MRKIPTIFEREWEGDRSRVLDKPNPECDWVFAGEGVATRKLDGTSCMVRDGKLFRRRELKQGQLAPVGFEVADQDEVTGKTVGWIPVGDGPEDKWHRLTFTTVFATTPSDGTFELIGPHIQGNPEKWGANDLVRHDSVGLVFDDPPPRNFDGLRAWLADKDIEGIVFHHPDGRMAKIKKRDFGMKR